MPVAFALVMPLAVVAHPRDEIRRGLVASVKEDGRVELQVTLSYGPLAGYRELVASAAGIPALKERLGLSVMRGV